jgi:hypothetical protein
METRGENTPETPPEPAMAGTFCDMLRTLPDRDFTFEPAKCAGPQPKPVDFA